MKRAARTGAIAALAGMFPMAFLVTLFWRFPMPMGSYESGFEAAVKSLFAVLFYLVFGGFLIVGSSGAVAGVVAFKVARGDPVRARKLSIVYGALCALLACLLLSGLEKIIGAW